jgi:hypothetical protein
MKTHILVKIEVYQGKDDNHMKRLKRYGSKAEMNHDSLTIYSPIGQALPMGREVGNKLLDIMRSIIDNRPLPDETDEEYLKRTQVYP